MTGPEGMIIECGSLRWDMTKDEVTFRDGATFKMKHRLIQTQDADAYLKLQGIASGTLDPSVHGRVKVSLTKPPNGN